MKTSSQIIIERLTTGLFGEQKPVKHDNGGAIPERPTGQVTESQAEGRPTKHVSTQIDAYEGGFELGGAGGDMKFPYSLGGFSVVEDDSPRRFTSTRTKDESKGSNAPAGKIVEGTDILKGG